jgi:sugar phosphate isomerase/epimerase
MGRRFSVSTWSLNRTLGRLVPYGPEVGNDVPARAGNDGVALLDLPTQLAAFGIHTVEICHFHLPTRDPGYLDDLRAALAGAGVELFSFLVDAGDITHPTRGSSEQAWIAGWLEVAGRLGAKASRVIAGKSAPNEGVLKVSAQRLRELATVAEGHGVRLMTENWMQTTCTPGAVLALMEALDGRMGLCADFGNWHGAMKYSDLAQIMPLAESCHAKCTFDSQGEGDWVDYTRCLDLTRAADFAGPYTLIYDGANADEWQSLRAEMEHVERYLG